MAYPDTSPLAGFKHDFSEDGEASSSDQQNEYEDSRTAGFKRTPKRRKLSNESRADSIDESAHASPQEHNDAKHTDESTPVRKCSSPGVVYISRIPPYLKPQALRQMISVHGQVTNVFLTPEPPSTYHTRVRVHHGNKKRQYIDGWVEFKHKRHAKACVDALNGRTTAEGLGVGNIGGRKGGKGRWYRDDVWSVKYLRGFSWNDLMQSARTEEREREERVRFGIAKEKKEREAFLAGVQGAKINETRKRKQNRRLDAHEEVGLGHQPIVHEPLNQQVHKQSKNAVSGDDQLQRVLSKIF